VFILSGAALALRRSIVEELGYVFDEGFWAYAEDWDLGFRLQSGGYRCVLAPEATVYHLYSAKTALRWASWLGTMRNLRNRYLAFHKVSTWPEYAGIAALLTVGSPLNAFDFGLRIHQKLLFSVALIPTTLVAAGAAVVAFPKYSASRKALLANRSPGSASMLRRLWQGRPRLSN
jgi:GT2 family glycosyltransferase